MVWMNYCIQCIPVVALSFVFSFCCDSERMSIHCFCEHDLWCDQIMQLIIKECFHGIQGYLFWTKPFVHGSISHTV